MPVCISIISAKKNINSHMSTNNGTITNTLPTDNLRDQPQWFVLRVKWRHEDDVERLLSDAHVPTYVARAYRLVADRRTKQPVRSLVVMLPEIVFAYASHRWLQSFINEEAAHKGHTIFFCTMVRDGRRTLMTVPSMQMESFMSVACQTEEDVRFLKPDEVSLVPGDQVIIHGGPFDGVTGTLQKVKGLRQRRVVVSIEGLMAVATTEIEPDYIEVVSRAKSNGIQAHDVSELLVSAEQALVTQPLPLPMRRALDMAAQRVLAHMGPRTKQSASVALALLTYAQAVGDSEMLEREKVICLEHVSGMGVSHFRDKMVWMLREVGAEVEDSCWEED